MSKKLMSSNEENQLDNLNTKINLGKILRRIANATGDTDFEKTPLSEMSDTGYENMADDAGYILHELKAFANSISPKVESKANRSELGSIWRSAETNFATKANFQTLTQFVDRLQEKCETIADLQQAVNQLSSADVEGKLSELQQAVNKLAGDDASSKIADLQKAVNQLSSADVEGKLSELQQALNKLASAGIEGKLSELQQSVNYLASLDCETKLADLMQSVNYLSTNVDHLKCYTADITISSAELLALNATPKTLIPAPGAGKYCEIVRVEFYMPYGTVAYAVDAAEDLSVEYATSGQLIEIETTGFLDQTADQRRCVHHESSHLVGVDEAVMLKMLTGEVTTGDSDLKCRIDYRIVEVLT